LNKVSKTAGCIISNLLSYSGRPKRPEKCKSVKSSLVELISTINQTYLKCFLTLPYPSQLANLKPYRLSCWYIVRYQVSDLIWTWYDYDTMVTWPISWSGGRYRGHFFTPFLHSLIRAKNRFAKIERWISIGIFQPKLMDHLQRWSRIFRSEETETDPLELNSEIPGLWRHNESCSCALFLDKVLTVPLSVEKMGTLRSNSAMH